MAFRVGEEAALAVRMAWAAMAPMAGMAGTATTTRLRVALRRVVLAITVRNSIQRTAAAAAALAEVVGLVVHLAEREHPGGSGGNTGAEGAAEVVGEVATLAQEVVGLAGLAEMPFRA